MADDSELDYKWREVSPGRLERDLDEVELWYASLAKLYEGTGHSFFAITGYLEVSLQISPSEEVVVIEQRVENAFRVAWTRLHFDHPTIASFPEYDRVRKRCRKVYKSPENGGQGKGESDWLESSFKVIDNNQSGLEFANADPPVQQHASLYLVRPPTKPDTPLSNTLRRDIIFRCPHVTIDGMGTLMLLDNLVAHAAKALKSQEAIPDINYEQAIKNLSPPLRIAAPIPAQASSAQLDRFVRTRAAEIALREGVELLGIPFNRDAVLPRESRRVAICVEEAEAHALTERCKALGISVTHAFHAGIVLAVSCMLERWNQERRVTYFNYCLVNLRGQCHPPFDSSRHAASLYHSVPANSLIIDLTIPAKGSLGDTTSNHTFKSIVTKVKEYYLSVRSDPDFLAMTPLIYKGIAPSYPQELYCEVPPPKQSPSVSLSSMGILDRIIQPERSPFTVNAPWVTGDEYGSGVGVFLGSWRGKMSLSAVFNVAFHEEVTILGFLMDVKDIVFAGLDVRSEKD